MSFWDDFLPLAGGVAGFALGGPAGAAMGLGAGRIGANLFGDGGRDDEARAVAQQRIDLYNKLTGELPKYDEPGVMAQFRLAENQAGNFAKGQRESALQAESAKGGGVASTGTRLAAGAAGSQEGANRLQIGDLAASQINKQMLNQFNQENMMNRMRIAQGVAGGMTNMQDLIEREKYATTANRDSAYNAMGGALAYAAGRGGKSQQPMQREPYYDSGSSSSYSAGVRGAESPYYGYDDYSHMMPPGDYNRPPPNWRQA